MIQVNDLTQQFSNDKGIFDVSFEVHKGEVFGFLGPNGAGKSTTIRHLMGFMKPQRGFSTINGVNCWEDQGKARSYVGYLPGEISFLEGMSGMEFINMMAGMQNIKDFRKRDELIERLQFDPKTPIRKMSKGMKQKIGIVVTFMHDPEIFILDEPTSGLDPLMQKTFIDIVLEEKEKGKTFLMSSHSFAEIERTCDRAAIIKDGRIITVKNMHQLQSMQRKIFEITFAYENDIERLTASGLTVDIIKNGVARVVIQGNYNDLIKELGNYDITNMSISNQSLEEIFMNYYDSKEGIK
ncbi:ABC transporter ATP-binding protein [Cytobacillus sp. Hm23]